MPTCGRPPRTAHVRQRSRSWPRRSASQPRWPELAAILVTREQRGLSHLLVITTRHAPTVLDINDAESEAVMRLVRGAARAIDEVEQRPGISVWQNNGVEAHQAIPHFHVHVAGTVPGGGTDWDEVHELSIEETEGIAASLRPALRL